MLTDEILKALIEGIIYVAPEPVTLDGILKVLEGEERERVQGQAGRAGGRLRAELARDTNPPSGEWL